MLFNSVEFAIFFVVVFCLYHCLSRRAQNVFLLAASYFFYGCWDWRFLSLIMISTLVDYTVSLRMANADRLRRKGLLLISVCTNLGILGFFKYCNFFVGSAEAVLSALGLHLHTATLSIILPVGISFYTFQTMAYTIDVYRGRVKPTRDLVTFAVYVSFFPQLVAGPIERPQNLLPQLSRKRRVTAEDLASGTVLILIGLVRKVAIADAVAGIVDEGFANPSAMGSFALVCAVFLFGLQIYCDFAGYSDIARGTSRLLGIKLMENFNHPYFATNPTVFWRRWHISLSTWLRDYLYIPLGGNRGSQWFVYRNIMLTMLLGGLWHGAAWGFVIWGGIHGVVLVVHKFLLRGTKAPDRPSLHGLADYLRVAFSWAVTMLVVFAAWIFFRAPDFGSAVNVLSGITAFRGAAPTLSLLKTPLGFTALVLLIDVPQYLTRDHTALLRLHWVAQGVACAGLVIALVLLRVGESVPFIYFQF